MGLEIQIKSSNEIRFFKRSLCCNVRLVMILECSKSTLFYSRSMYKWMQSFFIHHKNVKFAYSFSFGFPDFLFGLRLFRPRIATTSNLLLVCLFVVHRRQFWVQMVQYIRKWVAFQIDKLETLQHSTHRSSHKIPDVKCWIGNRVGQVCFILMTF